MEYSQKLNEEINRTAINNLKFDLTEDIWNKLTDSEKQVYIDEYWDTAKTCVKIVANQIISQHGYLLKLGNPELAKFYETIMEDETF